MGKKGNVKKMESFASQLNDITFTDYYYRLRLLAKSMFKWNDLPKGIDEKFIEDYLYSNGSCVFFEDDVLGLMVSKYSSVGGKNHYNEPTTIKPYATNYTTTKNLENDVECVIIKNNDDMIPTDQTIELFAYRLADISRTIDINVAAQKTPVMIRCTEGQKLTLKNMFNQWSENEFLIMGDNSMLDTDTFEVLKTDAPIVFDKLQLQKHALWNECMTFLGINNANQDKKERLVDDEVQANNEQVELSAQVMLKSREMACKRINEIFKTKISVELRKPEIEEFEEIEPIKKEGGENDSNG